MMICVLLVRKVVVYTYTIIIMSQPFRCKSTRRNSRIQHHQDRELVVGDLVGGLVNRSPYWQTGRTFGKMPSFFRATFVLCFLSLSSYSLCLLCLFSPTHWLFLPLPLLGSHPFSPYSPYSLSLFLLFFLATVKWEILTEVLPQLQPWRRACLLQPELRSGSGQRFHLHRGVPAFDPRPKEAAAASFTSSRNLSPLPAPLQDSQGGQAAGRSGQPRQPGSQAAAAQPSR